MRTKSQYGKCPHMPNWVGFGVTKPSNINEKCEPDICADILEFDYTQYAPGLILARGVASSRLRARGSGASGRCVRHSGQASGWQKRTSSACRRPFPSRAAVADTTLPCVRRRPAGPRSAANKSRHGSGRAAAPYIKRTLDASFVMPAASAPQP